MKAAIWIISVVIVLAIIYIMYNQSKINENNRIISSLNNERITNNRTETRNTNPIIITPVRRVVVVKEDCEAGMEWDYNLRKCVPIKY